MAINRDLFGSVLAKRGFSQDSIDYLWHHGEKEEAHLANFDTLKLEQMADEATPADKAFIERMAKEWKIRRRNHFQTEVRSHED